MISRFSAITGYHSKSAIRVLNRVGGESIPVQRPVPPRVYYETFRRALVVVWEASDRVTAARHGGRPCRVRSRISIDRIYGND